MKEDFNYHRGCGFYSTKIQSHLFQITLNNTEKVRHGVLKYYLYIHTFKTYYYCITYYLKWGNAHLKRYEAHRTALSTLFWLASGFSVRWGPNDRLWFLCSLERATKNKNLRRRERERSQLSPALRPLRIHWHEISVMTKFSYCEYSSQVRNAEVEVIMLCRKTWSHRASSLQMWLLQKDLGKSMYAANSVVRSCEARKIHVANGKGVHIVLKSWEYFNFKKPQKSVTWGSRHDSVPGVTRGEPWFYCGTMWDNVTMQPQKSATKV